MGEEITSKVDHNIGLITVKSSLSYSSIRRAYTEGCKGAFEPYCIAVYYDLLNVILTRIFDEDTIRRISQTYNLAPEEYVQFVLAGKIAIKFMGASMVPQNNFPNKIFFHSFAKKRELVVLEIGD